MKRPTKIVFTVTNDLSYDQRMIRICSTLANAGYDVTLVGFKRKNSIPLQMKSFKQERLTIMAEKGKLLYIHFWLQLFFYLLRSDADIFGAIDLDTILPVYFASTIKNKKRTYDAHELFTELKEVISRPIIHQLWLKIARFSIPKFPVGYTIGESYAAELKKNYGVDYKIVRNATVLKPFEPQEKKEKYILYQGAVNVGRCFEQLIPAMKNIDIPLIVCGDGNFFEQAKKLAEQHQVTDKVIFKGYIQPAELATYTMNATVGITLFEETSLSNRLSLANRFFDYMHYCVPQLCIAYPEYININKQFEIASLIENPTVDQISLHLKKLLTDKNYYKTLQHNCMEAREKYCWQEETKTLLMVYDTLCQA
jgi:glycosyltransferase involved in cell wall biosynthesis